MNTYLQLNTIINNYAAQDINLVYESSIDDIKSLIQNLTLYGSPNEKETFMTLVIQDINNNGIGLAYLISRIPLILNNSDYMRLTEYVIYAITNDTYINMRNSLQKIDSKYYLSRLISDIDANMYFNIMQTVSYNIDLETKVYMMNIMINGLLDIAIKRPEVPHLVTDTSIEHYIDSYFLLCYEPIVKFIMERFLFIMKQTRDLKSTINRIISEVHESTQKMEHLAYIISITTHDIQYKNNATEEFYVVFNMIASILMENYVLNNTLYSILPEVALFFINNRVTLSYFS